MSIPLAVFALTLAQTQPDPGDLAARAGKAYRAGKVAEARELYASALSQHDRFAPALAGLGRIDLIEHHRESARRKLARAYQMAPNDPQIVRDFAASTDDKALEAVLLQRLLNLSATSDHDREVARTKLAIHRKLAGRATNVLLSGSHSYRLRMPLAYARDWRPYGWVLNVRMNSEFPMRLLVDTGARGVLLFRAKGLRLEPLAESTIGGFGDGSRQSAQTMLAKSMLVDGQLELGNVVVEALDRRLVDGVDGLISPDVFEPFLVTIDGPKKAMVLTPFNAAEALEGFQPLRRVGHLWMVEKAAGEQFVLDTGSSYTVIHEPVPSLHAETISLFGVSGEAKLARVSVPVEVSLAGSKTWTREAVAADLEPISEQFGIRISGFLGFPAVKRLRMSIDARHHAIRIEQ
jgi:hypothetical protein